MAAPALAKKTTGTVAVAQRVIRQGGGKPAPSDTVNAKLTPGETVVSKELSEEALAPLVALYQRQGHLTQQDIEQFLYPILQNLKGGEEGMNGGGRVGYAGGGGVVQTIKDMFTPANVLKNRREVGAMKNGTYQSQTEPAETPQAEPQAAPAQTAPAMGGVEGMGVPSAVRVLGGRGAQIDKAVKEAQGYVQGGRVAENPIQRLQRQVAEMPGKLIDSLKADPSAQAYSQAVNKALANQPAPTVETAPTPVAYKAGQAVGDVAQSLQSAPKFIAKVANVAGNVVQQKANEFSAGMNNQPMASIAPPTPAQSVATVAAKVAGTPSPSLANPAGTNPAKVKTAEEPGAAISARSSQPDPVSAALLEPAKPPGTGMVTNRQGRTVTVVGNEEPLRQNGGEQGSYSEIPAGTSPFPMDKLGNPQANPQIRTNLPPGNTVERAKDYVDNMQGGTFLGKQEPASATQKLAMYDALTSKGQGQETQPQGVASVAQRLQAATPSRWEQELKARNDPITGVGGVASYLKSRLQTSNKRSTANALAEMLNVANARDRTQMEGSLGQDRLNTELQGHELAADAAHERNLVDAQGNEISAVEKLANIAKGRWRETQEMLKAQGMQALVNAKTPEERQAVMEKYGPVLQQDKAETSNDVMQIDDPNWVQPPDDPLAVAPKILVRVNKNAGNPERLQVPGQQQQRPIPQKGQVVNGHKFLGGNPADPKSWSKV